MSDKPYAPTPQRLRRARREGDIARAGELASLVSFAGGFVALGALLPTFADHAASMLFAAVHDIGRVDAAIVPFRPVSDVRSMAGSVLLLLAAAGLPACGFALVVTRAATAPLAVKWSRIAPAANIKQIFSRETAASFMRASLAAVAACAVVLPAIASMLQAALALRGPNAIGALAWNHLLGLTAWLVLIGIVVAGFDTVSQARRRLRNLRMSYDELRRESKEQQGDPQLRGARKRRHRALARGGVRNIRRATVVVTNPTHIAVALRYAPPETGVPLVLARAADEAAANVRAAAREAGVPLIENVALARLLFARCEEGDVIPLESYAAVAAVIAAVTPVGSAARDA